MWKCTKVEIQYILHNDWKQSFLAYQFQQLSQIILSRSYLNELGICINIPPFHYHQIVWTCSSNSNLPFSSAFITCHMHKCTQPQQWMVCSNFQSSSTKFLTLNSGIITINKREVHCCKLKICTYNSITTTTQIFFPRHHQVIVSQ